MKYKLGMMAVLFPFGIVKSFAEDEGGGMFSASDMDAMLKAEGVSDEEIQATHDGIKEEPVGDVPIEPEKIDDVIDFEIPLDFEEKETPDSSKEDDIDSLTSDKIDVNSFPEASRTNVANLRKKIERTELILAEFQKRGITYSRKEDGTIEIKAPESSTEELTKLQTKLTEKEERLGRLSIIETESFKKTYDAPILNHVKVIYDAALGLAGDSIKTPEEKQEAYRVLEHLAGMSPSDRAATLQKSYPNYASTFIPMFAQIDLMRSNRDKAISEWRETNKSLGQQEMAQSQIQTKAVKERLKEIALAKVANEGFSFLKKRVGDDDQTDQWNKRVDQLNSQIGIFFEDSSPELAAEAFVRAGSAQYLLGVTKTLQEQNQKLRSRLRAFGDVEAGISERGGDRPGGTKRQIPAEMTAAQAAEMIIAGM